MDWKEKIIKKLGLPEDASDEVVLAALDAAELPKPAPPEPPAEEDSGATPLSVGDIAKVVKAAMQPLSAEIGNLKADIAKRDKQALIDAATAQGKVIALSADMIDKLSVADVKKLCEETVESVPLSAVTPSKVADVKTGKQPTADQSSIARMCGVDPAKVNW